MEDDKAPEIVEAEFVQLGTMKAAGPADVIKRATGVATQLAAIIDSRKLYSVIRGKKHVRVEGWTTLGAMLGVLPREVSVEHQDDGGYVAVVELVRSNDGAIIGRGSALCGMDETDSKGNLTWAVRPEYARRSMAVTRATGKAYRLGFSWIMTLAGYSPTPAEEMPNGEPKKANGNGNGNVRTWPAAIIDAIVDGKLAKNSYNAAAILNRSTALTPQDTEDVGVAWFSLYRECRNEGMAVPEAVAEADAWLAGEMEGPKEASDG